jgi:hypothetical protein
MAVASKYRTHLLMNQSIHDRAGRTTPNGWLDRPTRTANDRRQCTNIMPGKGNCGIFAFTFQKRRQHSPFSHRCVK